MIIPNIKKKIERFLSSETGLISKKKLVSAGVAIAAASVLLKSSSVVATHGSVGSTYDQTDIPRGNVVTGGETVCTIDPPQSVHLNCDDHSSWISDGHASCSDGPKTLYFTRTCYTHSDNFVPSAAADGKTVVSTHSHAYSSNTRNDVSLTVPKESSGSAQSWL